MSQSRLWGAILTALGVVLGAVFLLLVFKASGSAAGVLLGLVLVVIIALPLIFGGVFLMMRARREDIESRDIQGRRRTLESESLSRAELADRVARQRSRLDSLVQSALPQSNPTNRLILEDAVARLGNLSQALRRTSYERVGAFDMLAEDASDAETVWSIDATLQSNMANLERQVTDLTTSISNGAPDNAAVSGLSRIIARMENAVNERARVLTTSDVKPLPTVSEVLRGIQPTGVSDPAKFTSLKPNDALSYNSEDYVVTGKVEWSESDGTVRYTFLLGGASEETWLLVENGGTELAILQTQASTTAADHSSGSIQFRGKAWAKVADGTATVSVTGVTESRSGLFVSYRKYTSDGDVLWIEDWNEGTKVLMGHRERAENIELWIQ